MAHPAASFFRVSRPMLNQPLAALRIPTSAHLRSGAFRSVRFASTASGGGAGTTAEQQQAQSWFAKMWNSPIGLKTVHFWAPVMKWAIVLAGVSDFTRPAEKLSLTQNFALTATGLIWTRWCFVIRPQNYLLAAVNFFLGIVGIAQVTRITMYRQSLKNEEAKKSIA